MREEADPEESLPLDALDRIDLICLEYEKAWKRGETPQIDEALRAESGPTRAQLLYELLALEIEYRRRRGQTPSRQEYVERFPTEVQAIDRAFRGFLLPPADPWGWMPPERIGPYRITGILGEGGMGTVYSAEQEAPIRRPVALKVIKVGMDSREVVARFKSERQLLAILDHPSIARMYDAGATPDGRPYFAMERVEGESITVHCDRRRLPVGERVALFLQVCEAVGHAHGKGIIHRDLKPSNILVSLKGGMAVAKVIDFGVAKAVDRRLVEQTVFTERGQILGTPEYMSPEQAEAGALDVDQRSDVYSLGVILYELLTGVLPFDPRELRRSGYAEIQRVIREKDPPRPSARLRALGEIARDAASMRGADLVRLFAEIRGDLDAIVMKALEKDRERRYPMVSDLGGDLGRKLRQEPVRARPPSVLYRAQKLLRRHRQGVAALAVFFLLSAVLVALGVRMVREAHRRADAEYEPQVRAALDRMESTLLMAMGGPKPGRSSRFRLLDRKDLDAFSAGGSREILMEAEAALGEAEASVPERPEASYHRARALRALGRPDAAISCLGRLLGRRPEFVPAILLRARIRRDEGEGGGVPVAGDQAAGGRWSADWIDAHRAIDEGRWGDAERSLGSLIDREAKEGEFFTGASAELFRDRGIVRIESGDAGRAVEDLSLSLARHPSMEVALLSARASWLEGKSDEARSRLRSIHEASRYPGEAILAIACALWELDEWGEGLGWAEKLPPGQLRERLKAGFLGKMGRGDDAASAAREAIRTDPNDAVAQFFLAAVVRDKDGRPEAIREMRKAIELDPCLAAAHTYLGVWLEEEGRLAEAYAEFCAGAGIDPDCMDFCSPVEGVASVSAKATAQGADLDTAVLERAIERIEAVDPGHPRLLVLREVLATTYLRNAAGRDISRALDIARRAVEATGGRDPDLLVVEAEVLFETGAREEAIVVLERALRLPNFHGIAAGELAKYRKELLPDLVSLASIDAAVDDVARREGVRCSRLIRTLAVNGSAQSRSALELLAAKGPWSRVRREAAAAFQAAALRTAELPPLDDAPAGDRGAPAPPAHGDPILVFSDDFEAGARPEWSTAAIERTPQGGRTFLGRLRNETAALSLEGLPGHEAIRVSFALFVIGTWDGSDPSFGPDVWDLRAEGGPCLLRTTFAHGDGVTDLARAQAFPDEYPGGKHPAGTGAVERGTLGFISEGNKADSVYRLSLSFPHRPPTLTLRFSAEGIETGESWGLDDVKVEAIPAVKPALDSDLVAAWEDLGEEDPERMDRALSILSTAPDTSIGFVKGYIAKEIERAISRDLLDPFRDFLSARSGESFPVRAAYLEARLCQEAGRYLEAIEKFGACLGWNRRPEPYLRKAECLRAAGQSEAAEAVLRETLGAGTADDTDLWDLWFEVSILDLKRRAVDLLESSLAQEATEGWGADLQWALRQIDESGSIRIRCGGEGREGKGGEAWGRDRFFTGGYRLFGDKWSYIPGPFVGPIRGTEDAWLYRGERWFDPGRFAPAGYRIPLEPGRYGMTLHFAECLYRGPGNRVFHVFAEGSPALVSYEPLKAGFAVARRETFEVEVRDGFLDLEFRMDAGAPEVSGIEVRRLGVASVDLGEVDREAGVTRRPPNDGETAPCFGGAGSRQREGRTNVSGDGRIRFRVTAPDIEASRHLRIGGRFWDDPAFGGRPLEIGLEYRSLPADGKAADFATHPDRCIFDGSGRWGGFEWPVADAGFASTGEGDDFRILVHGDPVRQVCLDRVVVRADPEQEDLERRLVAGLDLDRRAVLDLGATCVGSGLRMLGHDDGRTAWGTFGPEEDRREARVPRTGTDHSYFTVVRPSVKTSPYLWIRGTFLDAPAFRDAPAWVGLNYTTARAVDPHDLRQVFAWPGQQLELKGCGRWVTYTWHLDDAGFRDLMQGTADFRLWSSSPVALDRVEVGVPDPEEVRVLEVLGRLFREELLADRVVAALEKEPGLDERQRDAAARWARERGDVAADPLASRILEILLDLKASVIDRSEALQMAQAICKVRPEHLDFVSLLGAAQFRLGKTEEALQTLTAAEQARASSGQESNFVESVFLALVYGKLGRTEEARKALAAARSLPGSGGPPGRVRILEEAAAVVEKSSSELRSEK